MMTIYDVLCIKKTNLLSDHDIQQAYDALVRRYHPVNHPAEIQALSLFLRDADQSESKHRIYCVKALETLAKEGQTFAVETLEIISTALLNDSQMDVRECCCHLLAYISCNKQRLPPSVIQALEHVLEQDDEKLGSIAASALSQARKKNAPGFFSKTVERVVDGEIFGSAIVEIAKFGDAVVKKGIEFTEGQKGYPKAIIEVTEKLKSIQEATEGDANEHHQHGSGRRNFY